MSSSLAPSEAATIRTTATPPAANSGTKEEEDNKQENHTEEATQGSQDDNNDEDLRREYSELFGDLNHKELGFAFQRRLLELLAFRRIHGHVCVPKRYKLQPSLGNFVNKQRQLYRQSRQLPSTTTTTTTLSSSRSISSQRIEALNRIHFEWDGTARPHLGRVVNTTTSPSSISPAWMHRFEQLKQFLEAARKEDPKKNADVELQVPKTLACWMSIQRRLYRERQEGTVSEDPDNDTDSVSSRPPTRVSLSDQQIGLLESIGFQWTSPRVALWERRFEELRQFQQEHGHCLIPIGYPENPALANWVSTQRKAFNKLKRGKTKSSLTPERIRRLQEIGFVWNRWEYDFDQSQWSRQ